MSLFLQGIIFSLTFAIQIQIIVCGPWCFTCEKVFEPAICELVTKCADNEVCFAAKHVGLNGGDQYRSGCMPKAKCSTIKRRAMANTETCLECCQVDFCNSHLCNGTAIRKAGLKFCMTCEAVRHPKDCDQVELCGSDQQCSIEQANKAGLTFYTLGCVENSTCSKTNSQTHNTCCNTDVCNAHIPNVNMTSVQPGTQTTASSAYTVTTSTTPPVNMSTVVATTIGTNTTTANSVANTTTANTNTTTSPISTTLSSSNVSTTVSATIGTNTTNTTTANTNVTTSAISTTPSSSNVSTTVSTTIGTNTTNTTTANTKVTTSIISTTPSSSNVSTNMTNSTAGSTTTATATTNTSTTTLPSNTTAPTTTTNIGNTTTTISASTNTSTTGNTTIGTTSTATTPSTNTSTTSPPSSTANTTTSTLNATVTTLSSNTTAMTATTSTGSTTTTSSTTTHTSTTGSNITNTVVVTSAGTSTTAASSTTTSTANTTHSTATTASTTAAATATTQTTAVPSTTTQTASTSTVPSTTVFSGPRVPPHVSNPNQTVNVTFGENITLSCNVSGKPQPTVTWKYDKTHVFNAIPDGSSLHILYARKDNQEEYTCFAENSNGTAEGTIVLSVDVPVRVHLERPVVAIDPMDMRGIVRFKCTATGDPPINITWSKHGSPQITSDSSHMVFSDGDLLITGVNPMTIRQVAGIYTCKANNGKTSDVAYQVAPVIMSKLLDETNSFKDIGFSALEAFQVKCAPGTTAPDGTKLNKEFKPDDKVCVSARKVGAISMGKGIVNYYIKSNGNVEIIDLSRGPIIFD